jgi:hypothetical protein
MVLVVVDGKEYNLDEKFSKVMKYIEEAEVMEKGHNVNVYSLRSRLPIFLKKPLKKLWTSSRS